jgi:hypothetical protein
MKRQILFIFLTFNILPFGRTQSVYEILDNHAYLKSTNHGVKIFKDNIDKITYKHNLVEEINLRTETDRNDWARQEYALRIIFNQTGLANTYAKEAALLKSKIELKSKKIQQDLLFDLYKDLLELYFFNKEDSLRAIAILRYQKQIDNTISLVKNGTTVDAKDFLKIEKDIFDLSEESKISNKKMEAIYHKWQINKLPLLFQLSEVDMWKKVHNLEDKPLVTFRMDERNIDEKLDELDFQISKKDDHRILDFLQLRYSNKASTLFQDQFSLGLGLRIPYSGSFKQKKNRYQIQKYETLLSNHLEQATITNELKNEILAFDGIYNEYTYLKTQTKERQTLLNEKHLENISSIAQFRLDLQWGYATHVAQLHKKLWVKYLEIMHNAEQLNDITTIE